MTKNTLHEQIQSLESVHEVGAALDEIIRTAEASGYTVADINTEKPWGGFVRFDYQDGDQFVEAFFPDIDPTEARLSIDGAELSPKILVVLPGERLSWQRHARRAERWVFLTRGGYYKSDDPDVPGELIIAQPGDVVQFAAGECHRLTGDDVAMTYVAEIWQHTNSEQLSNEDDIERLADDYQR